MMVVMETAMIVANDTPENTSKASANAAPAIWTIPSQNRGAMRGCPVESRSMPRHYCPNMNGR